MNRSGLCAIFLGGTGVGYLTYRWLRPIGSNGGPMFSASDLYPLRVLLAAAAGLCASLLITLGYYAGRGIALY